MIPYSTATLFQNAARSLIWAAYLIPTTIESRPLMLEACVAKEHKSQQRERKRQVDLLSSFPFPSVTFAAFV